MKRAMVIGAAIVLTLLIPSTLVGWGPEGHEIVASLAETRLTENAKAGIRSLIGDASLASISNWADEVRPDRDETYNWHFVDIPKDASGFLRRAGLFSAQQQAQGFRNGPQQLRGGSDRDHSRRFSPTAMPHGMTESKP